MPCSVVLERLQIRPNVTCIQFSSRNHADEIKRYSAFLFYNFIQLQQTYTKTIIQRDQDINKETSAVSCHPALLQGSGFSRCEGIVCVCVCGFGLNSKRRKRVVNGGCVCLWTCRRTGAFCESAVGDEVNWATAEPRLCLGYWQVGTWGLLQESNTLPEAWLPPPPACLRGKGMRRRVGWRKQGGSCGNSC